MKGDDAKGEEKEKKGDYLGSLDKCDPGRDRGAYPLQ